MSLRTSSNLAHAEESTGLRLLLIALAGAILFHGGLLPFTHGNTYDAFIHMFFGDSYYRSWFDPWEPRWYTGFATTSYPPGTHMAIAGLMHFVPLRAAFVIVQLVGLLLLTIGLYRFSLLWVAPRAAGFAAIMLVLSSSISETVHLFGQLPTIFSLGIFLNGLPYVYRWIVFGRLRDLLSAVAFASATTAAHHVTTLFGGVLFVLPLGLQALKAYSEIRPGKSVLHKVFRFSAPLARGIILAVFMVLAIAVTVLPYWIWSINDPITQVPIPHGSRENFLVRQDLGFIFFVLPWGASIIFLPYAIYQTFSSRLWPLGASLLLCAVLGTGGTTPISRAILHGAFDVLTLDRFTFWATVLILPFIGHMLDGLLGGRSGAILKASFGRGVQRVLLGGIFLTYSLIAVLAAILPTIQPTQPRFIDPAPIIKFLESDDHMRWRYLTLGFGDQFAYLSAQTEALSVDGNYHSARRLPDLTRYSVERLENSKYLGVPGLGSLRQFLVNADQYHLKYVFSNDEFYDPILHFTGWTRLNRLANGVSIWEKPDVTPLPSLLPRRDIPAFQMLIWGSLPPIALILAALIFAGSALRRNFGLRSSDVRPLVEKRGEFSDPKRVRKVVLALGATSLVGLIAVSFFVVREMRRPLNPEAVIVAYFDDLDFRRFESAYERLDPVTRPDAESVMFNWRWRGGLVASYGKLASTEVMKLGQAGGLADWRVRLHWLTALDVKRQTQNIRTVYRDGRWYVAPTSLRPVQTPVRLQRDAEVAFNVVGRRQARPETDLHRDLVDRPDVRIGPSRLVERNGRYSLVGHLMNVDADPAFISLFGELEGAGENMVRQSIAEVMGHRLLPKETTGFRVDFEGVLSLEAEEARGGYDPTMFIPPELETQPDAASVSARAVVQGRDLYRGVGLNGVTVSDKTGRPTLEGLAVNTGAETATIVRVTVLLYDDTGRPIWAEAGFVEENIYPGQSTSFQIELPVRSEIRIVADVFERAKSINGSTQTPDAFSVALPSEAIALTDIEGYSALSLHVSTMTYDPVF
ncbi:MAG: hypothetical protein JJ894_08455 [Dinoroseobacter sp.]|nr:hypothetical protein [Dinoroseobacter sp.]